MRIQQAMGRTGLVTCVVLLMTVSGGCSNYYKVTDPTTGRVYYTKEMDKKQSAVTLRDSATGDQVTIQNSEIKSINKETFEMNQKYSGQVPETARAPVAPAAEPAPVAQAAAPAPAPEAAVAGATIGGGAAAAAAASAQSADQFRADLIRGKAQIDQTLASLTQLTDPNQVNLNAAYQNYNEQVAAMNQHAQRLTAEADAMRAARAEYFAKWDQKLAEIQNPTLRQSVEARRAKLRAGQEQLSAAATDVRKAYEPFTKDLQDIQKYLAKDLSKDSTSVMGETTRKALSDGQTVKQKVDVLIGQLDAIEGSTAAAPAAAPVVVPPAQ